MRESFYLYPPTTAITPSTLPFYTPPPDYIPSVSSSPSSSSSGGTNHHRTSPYAGGSPTGSDHSRTATVTSATLTQVSVSASSSTSPAASASVSGSGSGSGSARASVSRGHPRSTASPVSPSSSRGQNDDSFELDHPSFFSYSGANDSSFSTSPPASVQSSRFTAPTGLPSPSTRRTGQGSSGSGSSPTSLRSIASTHTQATPSLIYSPYEHGSIPPLVPATPSTQGQVPRRAESAGLNIPPGFKHLYTRERVTIEGVRKASRSYYTIHPVLLKWNLGRFALDLLQLPSTNNILHYRFPVTSLVSDDTASSIRRRSGSISSSPGSTGSGSSASSSSSVRSIPASVTSTIASSSQWSGIYVPSVASSSVSVSTASTSAFTASSTVEPAYRAILSQPATHPPQPSILLHIEGYQCAFEVLPVPGTGAVSVCDVLEGIRFVMDGVMFDKDRGSTPCPIFDYVPMITNPKVDHRKRLFKGLVALGDDGQSSAANGPVSPDTLWTVIWHGKRST